jgi:pimeloyl-ACP methyl ester carboxylesterase
VLEAGLSDIAIPTLILTGDSDETTDLEHVSQIVEDIGEGVDLTFGVINNTGHYQFSPIGCDAFPEYCDGQLGNQQVADITNRAALVFLARLLGWPDAGSLEISDSEFIEWQ